MREPKHPDSHEIAWCAGFFDGEGTFWCAVSKKGGNPMISMRVPQKELGPLVRFQKAILGLGKIYHLNQGTGINALMVNKTEDTQAVLAMLWRFLTPIKRDQYKRALETYKELYDPNLFRDRSIRIGEMRRQKSALRRIK